MEEQKEANSQDNYLMGNDSLNQMKLNPNQMMQIFALNYYRYMANMNNFDSKGNLIINTPINTLLYNPYSIYMLNVMNNNMNTNLSNPMNSNMITPFNYQLNNNMNNILNNQMNNNMIMPFNYQMNNIMNANLNNPMNNNNIIMQFNNPMNNYMNMSFNNQINNYQNILFNNQMNNIALNIQINDLTFQQNQILQNSIQNNSFINIDELVCKKIGEFMFTPEFDNLRTEIEILNYFSNVEEKCLDFINNTLNYNNYFLISFMELLIENIFINNKCISDKTSEIYSILRDIYVERLRTQQDYFNILKEIFGNAKIPIFLISRDIPRISLKVNKGNDTLNLSLNINKNFVESSKPLLKMFTDIIRKKIEPFILIKKAKYELLMLFIILNKEIFYKIYYGKLFFEFLRFNENKIKKYFGANFRYQNILEEFNRMTNSQENIKKEELFDKIKQEINNESNKIFNIIFSFYFLLIYVFKDHCQASYQKNLGNVYINLLLKKLVLFLDQKFSIIIGNINLYDLLIDIYSLDIDNLKKNYKFPILNNFFIFKQIDKFLIDDEISRNYYLELKEKLPKNGYEKEIRLVLMDANKSSNIITILIDGFRTEHKAEHTQFEDFFDFFKKETLFYVYKWPSFTKLGINFLEASKRARLCGILLAYILITKEFKNYQINLIGFSLGNHVIKHCIKALYNVYQTSNGAKFANLKNIIFIAGATKIGNKNKWKNYIKKLIGERVINCYSKNDFALSFGYSLAMDKKAIGLEPLIITDNENENKQLVENYEFQFGHRDYNYKSVISRIFERYKDI